VRQIRLLIGTLTAIAVATVFVRNGDAGAAKTPLATVNPRLIAYVPSVQLIQPVGQGMLVTAV